jgi:hypothetical protein
MRGGVTDMLYERRRRGSVVVKMDNVDHPGGYSPPSAYLSRHNTSTAVIYSTLI